MPSVLRLVLVQIGVLSLGLACDEPTSRPPSNVEPVAAVPEPASEPTSSVEASPETKSEPEPAPEPVGGPHCDQREIAAEGGEPKRTCIDFTDHTGASEPRCFEGAELSDGPCPSEGVIAKCKLEATGVTLLYYEGTSVDASRQTCATIDGKLEAL